jgi:FtsZ-binding cell division protein ZapB
MNPLSQLTIVVQVPTTTMSEKVKAAKRRTSATQDVQRAAATQCELEKSKKRDKTLHSMTCNYAQQIIELKNKNAALKKQAKDLQKRLDKYPGLASAPVVIAEDATTLWRKLELER